MRGSSITAGGLTDWRGAVRQCTGDQHAHTHSDRCMRACMRAYAINTRCNATIGPDRYMVIFNGVAGKKGSVSKGKTPPKNAASDYDCEEWK